MERKELEEKILELISKTYQVSISDISIDSVFGVDIAGESIKMVGLVAEIENELDAMVQLPVAAACKTIGELVDKVEEEL